MKLDRRPVTLAVVVMLAVGAYGAAGGVAAGAMVVLSLPLLGWAFDNRSGTFFVLGSLVTIAVIVLGALISLLALAH